MSLRKIITCFVLSGLASSASFGENRKKSQAGPTPLRRPSHIMDNKPQVTATEIISGKSTYNVSSSGVSSNGYKFPASRGDLEKAAGECKEYVAGLYARRTEIPAYRLPYFQQMVGEAQDRCQKLNDLITTIKQADEQLYSYQQAIQQAKVALDGTGVTPQSAMSGR